MSVPKGIPAKTWADFRTHVLNIRGTTCERCGRNEAGMHLTIHHIKYPKSEFGFWDLKAVRVICKRCHHQIHFPEEHEIPHDVDLLARCGEYYLIHMGLMGYVC